MLRLSSCRKLNNEHVISCLVRSTDWYIHIVEGYATGESDQNYQNGLANNQLTTLEGGNVFEEGSVNLLV